MAEAQRLTAGARAVARCRELARYTEIAGETTRLFLSTPMHEVHRVVRGWMEAAGMEVRVDGVGNVRGLYRGVREGAPRLLIGSHLDTVPNAGAFDGVLGVVMGIAVVEALRGERLGFAVEVIGFSEEEGVRFGKPFLGSLALVGGLDAEALARLDGDGISVAEAVESFGLGPVHLDDALVDEGAFAYLEFHIEQGPVLESEDRALGVVSAIAGQTRLELTFRGQANHAGTTPMHLRRDAMVAAARWIVDVERYASARAGLVATVGRVETRPGATNVVPGEVVASLDVRHGEDAVREEAVSEILLLAEAAAEARGVALSTRTMTVQASVPMDARLVGLLRAAAERSGFPADAMTSGAGHDAMIVAPHVPSVMLFLRSPGGLSHHPEEAVLAGDVDAGLAVALEFLTVLGDDVRAIPKDDEHA